MSINKRKLLENKLRKMIREELIKEEHPYEFQKILRSVLWKGKGWEPFWESIDNLREMLNQFRSVSRLPQNIDESDLSKLDSILSSAAIRNTSTIKQIEDIINSKSPTR